MRLPAITIRAPWWWLILVGDKPVENRSRSFPRPRGEVLVHASLHWKETEIRATLCDLVDAGRASVVDFEAVIARMKAARGCIVGSVVVTGSHIVGNPPPNPWETPGSRALELASPAFFEEPIACKGALGLWYPGPDVLARVPKRPTIDVDA